MSIFALHFKHNILHFGNLVNLYFRQRCTQLSNETEGAGITPYATLSLFVCSRVRARNKSQDKCLVLK